MALLSRKKLTQRLAKQGPSLSAIASDLVAGVPKDMLREIAVPRTLGELKSRTRAERAELLGVLGELIRRRVVRRGCHVACTNCGIASWYPIGAMDETLTCPGCAHAFDTPLEYPANSQVEIPWAYSLNTLMDTVMDQDGLPALAALYSLSRQHCGYCLSVGVHLLRPNEEQNIFELDFIIAVNGRLWGGECKAGGKIEEKDIARARAAAKLGIAHFYFCTMEAISEDSRTLVEALRKECEGFMQVSTLERDILLGGKKLRKIRREPEGGMHRSL